MTLSANSCELASKYIVATVIGYHNFWILQFRSLVTTVGTLVPCGVLLLEIERQTTYVTRKCVLVLLLGELAFGIFVSLWTEAFLASRVRMRGIPHRSH